MGIDETKISLNFPEKNKKKLIKKSSQHGNPPTIAPPRQKKTRYIEADSGHTREIIMFSGSMTHWGVGVEQKKKFATYKNVPIKIEFLFCANKYICNFHNCPKSSGKDIARQSSVYVLQKKYCSSL